MQAMSRYKVLFLLIFILVLFSGCEKRLEKKIEGGWILYNIKDVTTDIKEEWIFKDNKFYVVETKSPLSNQATIDTTSKGSYTVKWNFSKKELTIIDSDYDWLNATWDVVRLDKDVLMLVNNRFGGLTFKEFERNW